jgi:hypothetical protein
MYEIHEIAQRHGVTSEIASALLADVARLEGGSAVADRSCGDAEQARDTK